MRIRLFSNRGSLFLFFCQSRVPSVNILEPISCSCRAALQMSLTTFYKCCMCAVWTQLAGLERGGPARQRLVFTQECIPSCGEQWELRVLRVMAGVVES